MPMNQSDETTLDTFARSLAAATRGITSIVFGVVSDMKNGTQDGGGEVRAISMLNGAQGIGIQ